MYWYYKYLIGAVIIFGIGFGVFQFIPKDAFSFKDPSAKEEANPILSENFQIKTPEKPAAEPTKQVVPSTSKKKIDVSDTLRNAQKLQSEGKLDEAYRILQDKLTGLSLYSNEWYQLADLINEINTYIYSNSVPSERKKSFIVQKGQSLWDFAAENTSIQAVQISNKIPLDSSVIHVDQVITLFGGNWEIFVNKSNYTMRLNLDGKLFKYYKIGIGKDNRTPVGEFLVKGKKREPSWKGYPFGHPENVLGTRWMRLTKIADGSNEGYGIHGTSEPESIGTASSQGCIRMRNPEVEELFNFIPDNRIKVIIED